MPLSYSQTTASGSTSEFDVPFPYIDRAHVTVTVDASPPPLPFTWVSDSRIKLATAPLVGQLVEVRRETPLLPLVDYTDGASLTEEDLDTAYLHAIYIQQELQDKYDLYLGTTLQRLFDGQVTFETDPQDALDQLAGIVLEGTILDEFRQRIADIDLNAENIIATAGALAGVDTRLSGAEIDLTGLEAARAEIDARVTTLRSDHDALTLTVDGITNNVFDDSELQALIQAEQQARIDGDSALAFDLSLIGAKSGDGTSFILNLNTVKVDGTETLSQRLSALSAEDTTNRALIQAEETTRITTVGVEAARIDGLITRADGIDASILSEQSARIAGDTAISDTISLIGAKNGPGDAFILDLNTVKVSPTETLSQRFSQLSAATDGVAASAVNETNARVAADNALASDIASLLATANGNAAAIIAEQQARVDAIAAEATARTQLASVVTANTSAIQAEATTRSTVDTAFAQNFTLLGAQNGAQNAWVLNQNTVQIGGGETLATRLSGITASIGANTTGIAGEQTARISADNALASDITTVETSVNGLTSSVTSLSTSVDGIIAKHGVALNVNGHITGYVQNNNGTTGSFTVVADNFAVVDPGGGTPYVPFEIIGGVTRIKEAVIGSLTVGKLTSGTLTALVNLDGDIEVGSGRIIFDNGVTMKVIGNGFGTSSQFVEWFGPSKAVSACDEASATSYEKTDGSAYYGGSLSAGILTVKAETSLIASNASIETGEFETLGGSKQVVLSYSFRKEWVISNNASWTGNSSATVLVQRRFGGGGSWTTIGTLNVTGTTSGENANGPGEPGGISTQMGGSITVTDNSAAAPDMELRGIITSRTEPTINSTVTNTFTPTQRVSVISTEE